MSVVIKTFCGWGEDACRALGRWSLLPSKGLNWLADWFAERAR